MQSSETVALARDDRIGDLAPGGDGVDRRAICRIRARAASAAPCASPVSIAPISRPRLHLDPQSGIVHERPLATAACTAAAGWPLACRLRRAQCGALRGKRLHHDV